MKFRNPPHFLFLSKSLKREEQLAPDPAPHSKQVPIENKGRERAIYAAAQVSATLQVLCFPRMPMASQRHDHNQKKREKGST